MRIPSALLALALLAATARAEPPPGHVAPPAGPYRPAPVRVTFPGGACEVALAHWYTVRLVADGEGRIGLPLRWHAASGTVSLLGPKGDEMAVESLTCGPATDLHAAGARLPFRVLAERAATAPQDLACTAAGRGTTCQGAP